MKRYRITQIGLYPHQVGAVVTAEDVPEAVLEQRLAAGTAELVGDVAAAAAEVRTIAAIFIGKTEAACRALADALSVEDANLVAALDAISEAQWRECNPVSRALQDALHELKQALADQTPEPTSNSEGQPAAEATADTAQAQGGEAVLQDVSAGGSPAAGTDDNPRESAGGSGETGAASAASVEPERAPNTDPANSVAEVSGEKAAGDMGPADGAAAAAHESSAAAADAPADHPVSKSKRKH